MKLDALTSIKKDALDTNALKSIAGGRVRTLHSGTVVHAGVSYSDDRVQQEEIFDVVSHTYKWQTKGATYLKD